MYLVQLLANSEKLHLAQSERKALQPCCFATRDSSRRRSACGGLETFGQGLSK